MKKITLLFISTVLSSLAGFAQPELTVTAPQNNTATAFRAPNGTAADHTTLRGVIIVTQAELASIPSGTLFTKLGFIINSGATPGPAGGNIQLYLENTADVTNTKPTSWAAIVPPMTSVYNGAYSIPAAAGTVDITLTSAFNYTGGSLYVAWDYTGSTFTTTAAVYAASNTIAGGWRGSLTSAMPAADATTASSFRPSVRFSFANPFTNELNVTGVAGEKGKFNNTIKTNQRVTSVITNTSSGPLTNIPVTLTVTGANPYTATQTISSINAGASATVLFNNVPTISLGAQLLTITIPNDQQPANNSLSFDQLVMCDTIGYARNSVQSGGVGFNTGAGLIANRHVIPSNIQTYVNSVSNYFPTAASNSGNTIKGILMNGSGTIIDSTALITITAGMLGTKQTFPFINGAIDVAGDTIYVGFRQTANATTGYFPFANQANSYVDPNAAATFPLFGGTPAPLGNGLGYMMIDAALSFGNFVVPTNASSGTLCANSALTISPTVGYTNYDFFINGSSVQNGSTPSYTTGPLTATTTYNVSISNGSCVLNSGLDSVQITTSLINNISAGICPGQSYVFGSQTLTTAGNYSDTLLSASGCDSIVNLSLGAIAATSSSLSAAICPGGSYAFGGNILTAAGTYTDVVPNAAGCDSTITLTLTQNSATSSTLNLTECATSYQFGNQTLTASGTYTRTIPNAAGCDSVITLNLTLNAPVSVTASQSGGDLVAVGTPATVTYQWIDCGTGNAIPGATSATYSPTINGSYAVVVTGTNGCTDQAACITVNDVSIKELALSSSVTLYPNPATTEVHAVSNGSSIESYKVFDLNGRVILSTIVEGGSTQIEFSLEGFEQGAYIIELNTVNGKVSKSFVKK